MKRLGVFMLPPGWDASPSQGYLQHYAGTHLYTWVERSTVRVKCLAQEHNTMPPARPRTRTTRSGVEHTNHEATAPPNNLAEPAIQSKTRTWSAVNADEKLTSVNSNLSPRYGHVIQASGYLVLTGVIGP